MPPGLTLKNSTWRPHCVYVFCIDLRTNSNFCLIKHYETGFYNRSGVFTARYALIPYLKQIRFVFKGLILLFQYFPGEADENHRITHSIQPNSMPRLKPETPNTEQQYRFFNSDSLRIMSEGKVTSRASL
jgi:hypothetical protein